MTSMKKLLPLLFASAATPALGANHHRVGIGDCDVHPACFWPATLTIDPGDAITVFIYAETYPTGRHNVVTDDGGGSMELTRLTLPAGLNRSRNGRRTCV